MVSFNSDRHEKRELQQLDRRQTLDHLPPYAGIIQDYTKTKVVVVKSIAEAERTIEEGEKRRNRLKKLMKTKETPLTLESGDYHYVSRNFSPEALTHLLEEHKENKRQIIKSITCCESILSLVNLCKALGMEKHFLTSTIISVDLAVKDCEVFKKIYGNESEEKIKFGKTITKYKSKEYTSDSAFFLLRRFIKYLDTSVIDEGRGNPEQFVGQAKDKPFLESCLQKAKDENDEELLNLAEEFLSTLERKELRESIKKFQERGKVANNEFKEFIKINKSLPMNGKIAHFYCPIFSFIDDLSKKRNEELRPLRLGMVEEDTSNGNPFVDQVIELKNLLDTSAVKEYFAGQKDSYKEAYERAKSLLEGGRVSSFDRMLISESWSAIDTPEKFLLEECDWKEETTTAKTPKSSKKAKKQKPSQRKDQSETKKEKACSKEPELCSDILEINKPGQVQGPKQPISTECFLTYSSRVVDWFEILPSDYKTIQSIERSDGHENLQENPEHRRVDHAFSPLVDTFIEDERYTYVHENNRFLLASFTYADGSRKRGVISFAFDKDNSKLCYHRYFF